MSSKEKPILANYDLEYFDCKADTLSLIKQQYVIGETAPRAQGTQHKLFVSKSLLVYATENAYLNFNSASNGDVPIIQDVFYTFYHNIRVVYYRAIDTAGLIKFWAEGVLPEDARTPE